MSIQSSSEATLIQHFPNLSKVLLEFIVQQVLLEITPDEEGHFTHGSWLACGLQCFHGPSMIYLASNFNLVSWMILKRAFLEDTSVYIGFSRLETSLPRWLCILQAIASCSLFAISSAVVMNGAYVQFNLLLGLGKTLDCWCADIVENQDFISGIQSWNSLQALLKCVGREITPCFISLNLLGYVGFFVAITGSFTLLLDDGLEVWMVLLYESSLLPLLYLFYLSARLFAQGASLSERCRQIPAFVNQLSMLSDGADTDRQYLVRYISDSAAGFIVHGVTLSQSALLRQMHFLAAVCSGISGVLLRRYL